MAAIMEIEFKFCIPAGRLKAVEAALRRGTVARTRLQARYFDTADRRLAATRRFAMPGAVRFAREGWTRSRRRLR